MEQPFQIHIGQPMLDDLKNRIRATRWPEAAEQPDWSYGVSLPYLKDLADYWADDFDWRKIENQVNAYPQFLTEINGQAIHYLHIKSTAPKAVPLIITHGWPGSFLEMLNLIPLLTGAGTVSFDLVIPSLPGFGFSAKPASPGVNTALLAGLWVKLMRRLGYPRFIAQGGDFGAMVSTHIALNHPDSLIGLHLNYIPFNYQPFLPAGEKLTAEETAAQQKTSQFFQSEGAYALIQGTKPLTLAYGLNDSPVGLCAWILQIFKSFSNPALAPDELFNQDELLANVTLYWVTQTIYSSMHLYRAGVEEPLQLGATDFIQVPVGIAHYPYPDNFPARKYVERGYRVHYWKDMPAGGHFAAMEQPALFANDLKAFAKNL
jgi:pimeloyl-ACP methyl ester carboxylesterase